MAKKKREGIQQTSFLDREMYEPVDLYQKPPEQVDYAEEQHKWAEEHQGQRIRIMIGSTKSCPHCGEDIKLVPDGTVRCTKCWWWQGLSE